MAAEAAACDCIPADGTIAPMATTKENEPYKLGLSLIEPKIIEIRFLDQNRAVQMHGPGHELGVIEVITIDKRR